MNGYTEATLKDHRTAITSQYPTLTAEQVEEVLYIMHKDTILEFWGECTTGAQLREYAREGYRIWRTEYPVAL